MAHATAAFHRAHPLRSGSPPSVTDVRAVRRAAGFVTVRAASLLAAGVHAMWSLRRSASALVSHVSEEERPGMGHPGSFACNGSVVERYPGFRERVQRVVGALAAAERGQLGEGEVADPPAVLLHVAEESAIFGAAVAVACEKGNWR
jgi:hexokinase